MMTHAQAQAELTKRGFRYSSSNQLIYREYWVRTDGQPDVFLDHSATITRLYRDVYAISDYVNKEK